MKNLFKKIINTASAEKEEVNMTTKEDKPELAAVEQSADMVALLESATTALSVSQIQLAEMASKLEAVTAALALADEAKAALVAQAAEKKMSDRKQTIIASVGTAKADALLKATETLDDDSFKAVVGAMADSFEVEANTEAFKEVGVAVKTDPEAVVTAPEESEEAKLLRAKYKQSK